MCSWSTEVVELSCLLDTRLRIQERQSWNYLKFQLKLHRETEVALRSRLEIFNLNKYVSRKCNSFQKHNKTAPACLLFTLLCWHTVQKSSLLSSVCAPMHTATNLPQSNERESPRWFEWKRSFVALMINSWENACFSPSSSLDLFERSLFCGFAGWLSWWTDLKDHLISSKTIVVTIEIR